METRKVFVVDDDASICRALKCLLLTYGFEVETYLSGQAFFNAVAEDAPGCLVLDINMPGLDGWEVQHRLELAGSQRQVIVITADKDEGFKLRAMEVGAAGFLQKPFNDDELVGLINQSFEIGKKTVDS
jgi:FixJ family two-component response regulator